MRGRQQAGCPLPVQFGGCTRDDPRRCCGAMARCRGGMRGGQRVLGVVTECRLRLRVLLHEVSGV